MHTNDNTHVQAFVDLNYDYEYFGCISKPTRITHSTATIIDNVFVKDSKRKLLDPLHAESYVVIDDISNHFACIANIPNFFRFRQELKEITYRKISKEGILNINHELLHTDWSFMGVENCNDSYNLFHDHLSKLVENHLPMQTVFINQG